MKEIILKDNQGIQITNEIVKSYIDYIDVKDKSIETYANSLKQFIVYLNENNIKIPTRDDIIEYRKYLIENHKPNTVNLYLSSVKGLYNWLEYNDVCKDITKNIKSISIGTEHLREALTLEELDLVLSECKNTREKLIILLVTTCGIRANELVNIRIEDFKERQGVKCLYLLGKGRDYKQDFVVVDDNIFGLVKDYVKEYNIIDYLFISESNHNKNGKLTTTSVRRIVKNIFRKIGLDDEMFSFHSLRHSYATISLKNKVDIREVSQGLRHKNISTTMIYAHDLERLNNRCSNVVSSAILG